MKFNKFDENILDQKRARQSKWCKGNDFQEFQGFEILQ